MTKEKRWNDRNIHGNAGNDSYKFPEETFSVVVDPWALNWIKPVLTNDLSSGHVDTLLEPALHPANLGSEFTSWEAIPYGLNYRNLAEKKVDAYVKKAKDLKVLSDTVADDVLGDSPKTPPLAWNQDPSKDYGGHLPSGMSDSRVSDTRSALTNTYMGLSEDKF
jgi:hypothetical protein